MSEQEKAKSFMQELDLWTHANITSPLFTAARDYDDQHAADWEQTVERVNKAIRAKVLESYRNGQQAGQSKPARKEPRR